MLKYTIASGQLPPGVTLDEGGRLVGESVPGLNPATYVFTVRATDSTGLYSDRQFSITVPAANQPPVWSAPAAGELGPLTQNNTFNKTLVATDPEGTPVTYKVFKSDGTPVNSIADIIPGLSLDANTGVITGLITTFGTYPFLAKAYDAPGQSSERLFKLTVNKAVNKPPVWVTQANVGTFGANTAFTYQFAATDAENDPLTYSYVSGTLPNSVVLANNGTMSGFLNYTANASLSFTLGVQDPTNPRVDKTFTMNVSYIFVPDPTPDPLDWTNIYAAGPTDAGANGYNISGITNKQIVKGINVPITLRLTANKPLIAGSEVQVYVNGVSQGANANSVMSPGETSLTFTVNNNDEVVFAYGGYSDESLTFTVINTTDANKVLDTFTGTLDKTNEPDFVPDLLDWTDISAAGPTDSSYIPGISVAGNTNKQIITGVNQTLTLKVQSNRALAQGESMYVYKNGSPLTDTAAQMTQGKSSIQFTANASDEILFRYGAYDDSTATFTVRNVSNSANTVLDTFKATTTKTNKTSYKLDPLDWTNILAEGPTEEWWVPGVPIGANTNVQTLTGITVPVTLKVTSSRALASGEQFVVYVNDQLRTSAAEVMILGETSMQFTANPNDNVKFRMGGFRDGTTTYTVTNMSNGNVIVDTFTATLNQTNMPNPIPNWSNITASGPTNQSAPGISIGGNTNKIAIQSISTINLRIKASRLLANGENFVAYVGGNLAPEQMISGQDTINITVNNNEEVLFRFGGYLSTTLTFSVYNTSYNNVLLDTFTATLTKTN